MTGTVHIGCKLPNGLTLDHMGETVTLKGSNAPGAVIGVGITAVDEDFWTAWHKAMTENARGKAAFRPLDRGLVFVAKTAAAVKSEAKNLKKVRNGMEPLNPDAPAPGIEPTDVMKAELAKLPENAGENDE